MTATYLIGLDALDNLADCLCALDTGASTPPEIQAMIARGHADLIAALGQDEHIVYGPAEDERDAA